MYNEIILPVVRAPQIRSARIGSGTNPHCARIRNRPNTKCPNRKCYESELVLIVTARINNARISNGTNPKWYESETPDSEVVRIRSDTKSVPLRIRTTSNSGVSNLGASHSYHFEFGRFRIRAQCGFVPLRIRALRIWGCTFFLSFLFSLQSAAVIALFSSPLSVILLTNTLFLKE
uniref:Uncharacterized protein n=1 Tax=Caenorhabditis japonica TaxID=281687 RepID=A0A8R1I4W7_CAEJA